jgi:hypothetical protein
MEVAHIIAKIKEREDMENKSKPRNRAKCLKCGDIVESLHRHDFKWCKCKSLAVDGGNAYCRRVGNPAEVEEMP